MLLALGGGAIIWAATSMAPLPTTRNAPVPTAREVGICVTPEGVCNARSAPTGDPCSCPSPLRGEVRGRIQRLTALPDAQAEWSTGDRDDERWGRLTGR